MRRQFYLKEKKRLNKLLKIFLKRYKKYRKTKYKTLYKVSKNFYIRICFELEALNLTYKKGRKI